MEWLFHHIEGFQDRREARKYASNLLKAGFIRHTVNKITFSEQCYYVFGDLSDCENCELLENTSKTDLNLQNVAFNHIFAPWPLVNGAVVCGDQTWETRIREGFLICPASLTFSISIKHISRKHTLKKILSCPRSKSEGISCAFIFSSFKYISFTSHRNIMKLQKRHQ